MDLELRPVLRALRILSPASFSLTDRIFLARDESRLVETLESCLYEHCYTRRFQTFCESEAQPSGRGDDLTAQLSAANRSRSCWDHGWKVEHVEPDGRVLARKGASARRFWPGEYVSNRGRDVPVAADAHVAVFAARESLELQKSFYFAFGETVSEVESDGRTLRFYFHVSASGAVRLTEEVTGALNRFQVPFRFKCLTASGGYGRRDAAVLYLGSRYYRMAATLIARVHESCSAWLDEDTPLFARRLAPGLALAEDPPGEKSFGRHRCGIVAEAICDAAKNGADHHEDRVMEEIGSAFRRRGLNPQTPWLHFSATDPYMYPVPDV